MAAFIKGDVVVVPFPYSDLSQSKRRPAVVITSLTSHDLILCQMTSQVTVDGDAVRLDQADFIRGGLNQASNIRPNKLFTADSHIILYKVGAIESAKMTEVLDKLVEIIRR